MFTRRQHLALGALALAMLPGLARAAPRRIGLMMNVSLGDAVGQKMRTGFAANMRAQGLVEGKDYVAEWRSSEGKYERIPAIAAELVGMQVDVLVAFNTLGTLALKRLTRTIPIVFSSVDDPLGNGIVLNLAHPEANVTGFSTSNDSVLAKHLDLIIAGVPGATRIGLLRNNANVQTTAIEAELQTLLRQRGLPPMTVLHASSVAQLGAAFEAARSAHLQALIVYSDGFFLSQREAIAALAIKARLPAIARTREYVEAGLLYAYGNSAIGEDDGIAGYVAKLLKGVRPASLPVQQPRSFPFTINRKTAEAIGLTLSQVILLRADEVID